MKKSYPRRAVNDVDVSETGGEKHVGDSPPHLVNERDVLAINDKAIELVKDNLETHARLFLVVTDSVDGLKWS